LKVAVVTDDGSTVSAHFGRAQRYLVYRVEGGEIKGKEARDKAAHGPGEGHHHAGESRPDMAVTHAAMLANVNDCEAVIARGMGRPMYEFIGGSGMRVFITAVEDADEAVRKFASGTLDNHAELLH